MPVKITFMLNRMATPPIAVNILIFIFFSQFCLIGFPGQAIGTDDVEKLGFSLPAPENDVHKKYLGLSDDTRFFIGQIKAEFVIIEIFSMYCPVCQREAEDVNTMFRLIQSNPALKEKVKLIGIGAGNSPFEVTFFKEKYAIDFPLFSDPDFSIHKRIGEVRTPHFFGLRLQGNNQFTIFYSQAGEISDPDLFLQTLLKPSGIKKQP